MKDSRVKWASRSLIGDDATEGKDLMFPLGMAAIRAFNDDAEKWKAMYRILLHLQQMHNPQNKVVNFNADLWDGRHWDDLLLLLAEYQPLCANLTSLCAHVLKVTPQDLLLSGNVDNQALTSSLLLCNPSTTTRTITGFAAIEGAMVKVENLGAVDLVLSHQGGTSDAANRMISPTGFDITVSPNDGVWIAYDSTSDRWRINA